MAAAIADVAQTKLGANAGRESNEVSNGSLKRPQNKANPNFQAHGRENRVAEVSLTRKISWQRSARADQPVLGTIFVRVHPREPRTWEKRVIVLKGGRTYGLLLDKLCALSGANI